MAKQSFRQTWHDPPKQKADELPASILKPEAIAQRECRLEDFISLEELEKVTQRLPPDFSQRFQQFKGKYKIPCANELEQIEEHTQNTAQRIKHDHPFLLQNISYFLYQNGILLFCVPQKLFQGIKTRDGLCFIPEKETDYPIIIISEKAATPRRRFFTIAHEVYHLLAGDGEDCADKFAGSMLISKQEIIQVLQLDEKSPQIERSELEEALHTLYHWFPVSLECIIFTLADYQLISKDIKKTYSGKPNAKKRQQMIKSWDVPPDLEEITDIRNLLTTHKTDRNTGELYRNISEFPDIEISEDFDEEMPVGTWQRLEQ
ncbi:ImmA/IrrE family metallo-endopeptidase [Candidatus Haliotispira prima]|uniref:ImmA/IrrE family metallo-endopeptidase n=1 Tax=Candidatus Haliotispira prima TaxID=3034016 RepID=A0ABY8MF41_9SPIO|nr:ImmA/IrrE family metallo-endopeptidase [Candidatus Haliotispira prima]